MNKENDQHWLYSVDEVGVVDGGGGGDVNNIM